LLRTISLFEEITLCDEPMCKNQQHIGISEQFHTNTVMPLKKSASEALPGTAGLTIGFLFVSITVGSGM